MYAGRKRRRPVKRVPPNQGNGEVKSNPSKRHRDRLNKELDNLASLLPFDDDVISKLDKLSILRLSVSYLRNKSFFQKTTPSVNGNKAISLAGEGCYGNQPKSISPHPQNGPSIDERDLLLQALNGFMIVVDSDGIIFYASTTIHDFLGFHQSDVMNQSVYEIIHTEDRNEFRRQLTYHSLINTEQNTETQEVSQQTDQNGLLQDGICTSDRNFVTRFRCLLDNSSGFLALHFTGKIKPLFGQKKRNEDTGMIVEDHAPMALFALACPLQPPSIIEIHTRNIIFRTKHKLDFKPLSIDPRGIEYLGYNEKEFSSSRGYHMLHYEDLLYTAEQHGNLLRKGETGFIYFRLMTKHGSWLWVQAKGRVIFKNSKPDYIISTHRPMSEEEGSQHMTQRGSYRKFPFSGQAMLYNCNNPRQFMTPGMDIPFTPGTDGPPNGKYPKMGDFGPPPMKGNMTGDPGQFFQDCAVKMENIHLNTDSSCIDPTAMQVPMVMDAGHHPVTMTTGMQEHDYRMGSQGYYNGYHSYSNEGYSFRNFYASQQYRQEECYRDESHQMYRESQNGFFPMNGGVIYPAENGMTSMHVNCFNAPSYVHNNVSHGPIDSANQHSDQSGMAMDTTNQRSDTDISPGCTTNQMPACQYQLYDLKENKSVPCGGGGGGGSGGGGGGYGAEMPTSVSPHDKESRKESPCNSENNKETQKENDQLYYSSCCVNKSNARNAWVPDKNGRYMENYPSEYGSNPAYMQTTSQEEQFYAAKQHNTIDYRGEAIQAISPCSMEHSAVCNNLGDNNLLTTTSSTSQPLLSFSALADTLLSEK
ncbi:uncharacterized protein LOC144433153 [Glandiceps talaboti]